MEVIDKSSKSIELRLPEWVNWIAQDECLTVCGYASEPDPQFKQFLPKLGDVGFFMIQTKNGSYKNENWRDSKSNLNTHGAYIDAEGILHRCDLVPDMLKEQA